MTKIIQRRYVTLRSVLITLLLLISNIALVTASDYDEYYSDAELDQLLAPIALYPDTLLTHILISSAYPLEVIEAERWYSNQSSRDRNYVMKRIENKRWDPSVKALLAFPSVLERMSHDLSWTEALGNAFLDAEHRVLGRIQHLRNEADLAGNLDYMEHMDIVRHNDSIIIQSKLKHTVYVPVYDSRYVYGHWPWGRYQPIYWHKPTSVRIGVGPFYWHRGVHISFDFFFGAFHWKNRHVVVNHHYSSGHRHYYRPRASILKSGYAKRWTPKRKTNRTNRHHGQPKWKKSLRGSKHRAMNNSLRKEYIAKNVRESNRFQSAVRPKTKQIERSKMEHKLKQRERRD